MKVFVAALIATLSAGVKISEILGEVDNLDNDVEFFDAGADYFVYVDVEPEKGVELDNEQVNAEEESSDDDDDEEEILDQVEQGESQDKDDDLLGNTDDEGSGAVVASSDSSGVAVEELAQIENSKTESGAESGSEKADDFEQRQLKAPMLPLHK